MKSITCKCVYCETVKTFSPILTEMPLCDVDYGPMIAECVESDSEQDGAIKI